MNKQRCSYCNDIACSVIKAPENDLFVCVDCLSTYNVMKPLEGLEMIELSGWNKDDKEFIQPKDFSLLHDILCLKSRYLHEHTGTASLSSIEKIGDRYKMDITVHNGFHGSGEEVSAHASEVTQENKKFYTRLIEAQERNEIIEYEKEVF